VQFNLSQNSWLSVTDYPRAFVSFPRIAGSGNEIGYGVIDKGMGSKRVLNFTANGLFGRRLEFFFFVRFIFSLLPQKNHHTLQF
jgi:hypothetical protein